MRVHARARSRTQSFLGGESVSGLAKHERYENVVSGGGIDDAPSKIMRILVAALLLAAGCREQVEMHVDRTDMRKPVEADDDFTHTRAHFQSQMRGRLARLNARMNELGGDASVQLRAKRDQLAMEVEKLDERGEIEWDKTRGDLERSFTEVEQDLTKH